MESLPMAPDSCTLDQRQLSEQLGRYRTVGAGATVIKSTATMCLIRVADSVADHLVDELITVERGCCPFFDLNWDRSQRRLTISVSSHADEAALGLLAQALRGAATESSGR
jgi:hypothetical protein